MRTSPNETVDSVRQDGTEPGASAKEGPVRRCILSGERAGPDQLVRLALSPDGMIAPDIRAKAPGRGAWIGISRTDLEAAMAKGRLKGALARAFKGAKAAVPDDLGAQIEAALVRATLDRLGLEARGGSLLAGSDRIAEAARRGRVHALYHAADAGADGNAKLDQAWRVGSDAEGSSLKGLVLPVDRASLSMALGRENVVHIALTDAKAAARVDLFLGRLLHFTGAAGELPAAMKT
ncbi:MAG: DUF448 domain-containing protein [Blastomonas sp.]